MLANFMNSVWTAVAIGGATLCLLLGILWLTLLLRTRAKLKDIENSLKPK